jgi:ferredoxin
LTALPAVRLSNNIGENWQAFIIRPPGSLSEEKFLLRCIKCGQCMRICPTNVIQPGSFAGGLENLWTPVHNNRIGTSGCQLNCTACGLVCPTAAIRPISLSEKLGLNEFAETGPIKIGTAFIDRSRCLPWAMEKPCIVCQENCPVSPKSIYTRESFEVVRDGRVVINKADNLHIETEQPGMKPGGFATGDYYFRLLTGSDTLPRMITANTEDTLMISPGDPWSVSPAQGSLGELCVRLQKPFVDIEKCIGCGTCEHECPVNGKRAVTVSAEGESRSLNRTLLLNG